MNDHKYYKYNVNVSVITNITKKCKCVSDHSYFIWLYI